MGSRTPEIWHLPVLTEELIGLIVPVSDGLFIDCTLGFGGHSLAILQHFPKARIIALDQDVSAIETVKDRFTEFSDRIEIVHSNFSNITKVASDLHINKAHGVFADLGVSSMQLDSESRGFSFRFDAPLDMRMDESAQIPTAAELLDLMDETEIADTIFRFGEERHSRRIARRIVREREAGRPIKTTKQLADLVATVVPRSKHQSINPATKTFQALRIMVNRELEILEQFLIDGSNLLAAGGILAVITFHSLEDRIVKNVFQRIAGKCICPPKIPVCVCRPNRIAEIITKKPIRPSERERAANPRSRSAKLRAVRKLDS